MSLIRNKQDDYNQIFKINNDIDTVFGINLGPNPTTKSNSSKTGEITSKLINNGNNKLNNINIIK